MTQASPHRQLTALVTWAMARIAELDSLERYEESFALTEEFRDWILGLDHQPERLDTLLAPQRLGLNALDRAD
ncbi:hypothetical protein KQ304_04425 [Synechococcus sp. CS-1329]|jgi:hypothetical protein|uniref:hypothetical protein n=1 Tax=Synechococcus sp. CS-1329 TaxID=2847975 RepID=UPI00223BBE9E|nr:hypothetical protein [Synechococcus sp. CS-1329]MCT0218251.1 hypothetical protein [Synechococcus sp. CS-1329]